jgi:hypothetical protein
MLRNWGHLVAYWLRHYATNRKATGSIPDEVNFLIYIILLATLGLGVYSTPPPHGKASSYSNQPAHG